MKKTLKTLLLVVALSFFGKMNAQIDTSFFNLSKTNLTSLSEMWMKGMDREYYYYGQDTGALVGYGILFLGNYKEASIDNLSKDGHTGYRENVPEGWSGEWNEWCKNVHLIGFRKAFVNKIYESKNLQKKVYSWMKPRLDDFFTSMYLEDTGKFKIYQEAVKHCREYVENFSLEEERKKYEADPDSFTDEKGNHFRKLECWIYRRIAFEQMSKKTIKKWIKIVDRDFFSIT